MPSTLSRRVPVLASLAAAFACVAGGCATALPPIRFAPPGTDVTRLRSDFPLTDAERLALTPESVRALTQDQVDQIYLRLSSGAIPDGPFRGDLFFPRDRDGRARVRDLAEPAALPLLAATAAFAHRFETPGEHAVEVRLADDPLLVDNHRWLSTPVRESIRVLCVQGKQGAAEHVAYALSPTKTDRPRVRAEVVVESLLLELDLNNYDAIFLCNVGRFGRDDR